MRLPYETKNRSGMPYFDLAERRSACRSYASFLPLGLKRWRLAYAQNCRIPNPAKGADNALRLLVARLVGTTFDEDVEWLFHCPGGLPVIPFSSTNWPRSRVGA